jgi:hypothetical protein
MFGTLSMGCSFAATYGPARSQRATVEVSCTEEQYAPALDVAAAGGSLLYSAVGDQSTGARLGLAASAIAWAGSAVYGYMTTTDCRRAKDAAHRYHTKLLLRQIDLLNEAASEDERGEKVGEPGAPEQPGAPAPSFPLEESPAYVPPPP